MKVLSRFLAGGALLLALAFGASTSEASHNTNHVCNGNNGNYHAGAVKSLSNITGIKATIEVQDAAQCDENATNSSAWSMGNSYAMVQDGTRYVQAGWAELEGYAPRHFAEYSSNYDYIRYWYGTATAGSTYTYEVWKESNCRGSEPIDLGPCWRWTNHGVDDYALVSSFPTSFPSSVEYAGETWDQADQMPGTTANPVGFTSMQYRDGTNWTSPALTNTNKRITHPRGNVTLLNGNEMYIWDSNY